MTGAMYAGISGMRAHMNKLNVIGNNVANVNTVGYKAGFTTFVESIYNTTKAGSNGTATAGGTNPVQTGFGVQIGTVDLDMSTKNYMPTGIPTHSMIDGDGFYMVGDKNPDANNVNPEDLLLSRSGNFGFKNGYLVDGAGNIVYGFLNAHPRVPGANGAVDRTKEQISTQLAPIRLPMKDTVDGSAHLPEISLDGRTVTATDNSDATTNPPTLDTVGTEFIDADSISIGKDGAIMCTNSNGGKPVLIGYVALAKVQNPSGVTHMGGTYYRALEGAGNVGVASILGSVEGYLNNVTRNADGKYFRADGTTEITNPAEIAALDLIISGSATELVPGGLESSGTDVATEFSEMITTQRGYQANTRIITVTDTMLEELVNIKR